VLITPTLALCKRAAHLADRFGLRGYDSIHLAAAEALMIQIMPQKMVFASFDQALNRAAAALGLTVI
jgi:predicted nucleic acid-binding protein